MKLLDIDSPLMRGLSKIADLMWLNILTLLCCIPIVTVGASLTAMHYTALKIVRGEEAYISRNFFHSFKQNFRQATIVWVIQLLLMAVLASDYYLIYFSGSQEQASMVMQIALTAATLITATTFTMIYPLMAKFENTLPRMFKNAILLGLMKFPIVLVMLVLEVLPILIAVFFLQVLPLVVLFGFVLSAYVGALLYNKSFKKMEEKVLEKARAEGRLPEEPGTEDEHIFSDTLEPAIEKRDNAG